MCHLFLYPTLVTITHEQKTQLGGAKHEETIT